MYGRATLRVSVEAMKRFSERYPSEAGTTAFPRLQLALRLAQQGKGNKEYLAHRDRKIFDIELPADSQHPEPIMIRIVTTKDVCLLVTVLPPEFRQVMHAKKRKQEFGLMVEDIDEPEETAEPVTLQAPVKVGTNLGALDELKALKAAKDQEDRESAMKKLEESDKRLAKVLASRERRILNERGVVKGLRGR
jgi:hypothetical protein